MPEDRRKKFYDQVTGRGVKIGSWEKFNEAMDDEGRAKDLYSQVTQKMNIGTEDKFLSAMYKKKAEAEDENSSSFFSSAWNSVKTFLSPEPKEVKDNLEILKELKGHEDNPFSQGEIRKVEHDIKKGIVDNNDGTPAGMEIRKGTDDLAKARLMYNSWENDPEKSEQENSEEFYREFLEYTGRGGNVEAAASEDEYRRKSNSIKDIVRNTGADKKDERVENKEDSDNKEKQKRKTGSERLSLGANKLQKEILGHEIKDALLDPEVNELTKTFNNTRNELESLGEELQVLNDDLKNEPDLTDAVAVDVYNEKVAQFQEKYESFNVLQEQGRELSKNPKLIKLAELDEQSQRIQVATTQMFKQYPEMFAEFKEREEKQKVVDDLYKNGGTKEYVQRAVVAQAGRALTNMVGGIMNIPTYFDGDDKYTGIDAYRDFTFKAVDYVDELSFAIPSDFNKPISEIVDGKRVYNTELIIPKSVRAIADMFTLMYGANKISAPLRALNKGKTATAISQGVGLFTSSYLTTHNSYYKEGLSHGLSPSQASNFATTSSMVTSALEMINPQRYLLGGGSVKASAKAYVKSLGKGLSPKLSAKKALSIVGKEIAMEELQEFSQLVGDRVTQYAANKALGGEHFQPSEKFMDEAIETFILTAIATPFAAAKGAKGIANEYYYNAIKAASENPDLLKKLGKSLVENKVDAEAVKRITRDIQDMQMYKGTLTYNTIVKNIQERMKVAAQATGEQEDLPPADTHGETIADHIGERVAYGEVIGTLTVEEDGTISVVNDKGQYYEVENSGKDLDQNIEDVGLSNTELTRIQLLEYKANNAETKRERIDAEKKLEEAYERYETINNKPAPKGYVSGGQEQTDTKTEEVSDKNGEENTEAGKELQVVAEGIAEGEEHLGKAITTANKSRIERISSVVKKALANIAPNTQLKIVESKEQFLEAYKELTGKDLDVSDDSAEGFYHYDANSNTIVVDASRAGDNVTFHEFAHPIAKAVKATNPEAYQKMVDLMGEETFEIDGVKVTYMEWAKNEYKGEALTAEEAVVEFLADMATEKWDKIENQNVVQKLVSMAKRLLDQFFGDTVTLDLDNINTPQELRVQLEKITDAMVEGKPLEISKEESQAKTEQKSEESQAIPEQKANLSKPKAPTTENFKKWFDKSKVVNEDGSPKIVHHGTSEVFTAFKEELANYAGYYFAEERQLAQDYADYNSDPDGGYPLMKMEGKTPVVLDTYLSIQNPAYYDAEGKLWSQIGDDMGAVVEEAMFGDEHDGVIITNLLDPPDLLSSSVPPSTVFIAKNPNQIKSVDNNGEFSTENDDIYFSKPKQSAEDRTLDILNTDLRGGLYMPTHIPLTGGKLTDAELPQEATGRVPDFSKPKRKNMADIPMISFLDIMKDKFSVTMSDHTLVGDVYNERTGAGSKDIMGGFGFSYIKGNMEHEVVWAGVTIKAARLLVRDSKGMPATLVFRMARESGSMGNFTYLSQAVEELKAPIAKGKITEKEFLEKFNEKLGTIGAGKTYQKRFGNVKSLDEFKENLRGASFGYRGNLWKTILKNDNVASAKGNPWYTFLEDLGVAPITEINDLIAEPVTDQAIDGDIIGAIEVYDPEMVEVPVGRKGKTKVIEKIYTTDKNLVNEGNGVFFIDAPHHNSYPYVVKGKPLGVMDSFLPITEYYPNMKRWLTHDKNGNTKKQYDALPNEEKNLKKYNPKNAAKLTEEEYNALPLEQRVRGFEKRLKSPYKAVETMVAKLNQTHKGAVKSPKVTDREPVFSKPKKLSKTAQKIANSKRESWKPLRDDIKANPDRYSHEKQDLAEASEMLSTASESKINSLYARHIKLAKRGNDTNLSTLASIEKLNRINVKLQNAIDTNQTQETEELREEYVDTLEVIVQAGTSLGQLLRQYGELTKSTSIGLVRMVKNMLEKKGFHMDAEQDKKVTELARVYLASDKLRSAKLNELKNLGTYSLLEEYEVLDNDTKQKYNELATFMMRIVPKGKAESLGLVLQGNLLTFGSIVTNVVANSFFSPMNGVQNLMADLVSGTPMKGAYGSKNIGNFIEGWKLAAKGSVSGNMEIQDMAKFDLKYDLRAFQTFNDIFRNPKARADWANKNGEIPASVWFEKSLTGTFGLNADMMFRMLYLGDKPFRHAAELAETHRIANEQGVKVKNRKDFRIFQLSMNEAEKGRVKEAGNIATFSDKRALSNIADKTVRGINSLLEEMIDPDGNENFPLIVARTFFKAMIPFVRVPANLLQDTAEFALAPLTLTYAIGQHIKGNTRLAGRYYGKAMTGLVWYGIAGLLHSLGAIVGDDREDDEARRSLEYEAGKRGGVNMSVVWRLMMGAKTETQVGDLWIDYKKLGQIGMFLSYYANSKDEIDENGYQDILNNSLVYLSKITGSTLEASFMTSIAGMLDAISGDNGNFVGQVLATTSNIVLPNNVTSLYTRTKRNYILTAKDQDFLDKIATQLKLRLLPDPESAEPVVSFSGQLIDQTQHEGYNGNFLLRMLYQNVNIFKPERADNLVAIELVKLGRRVNDPNIVANRISDRIKLPEVKLGLSGEMEDATVKVHPSDHTDLKMYIGRMAFMMLEELIDDPAWKGMSDSEKAEEVKAIYEEANAEIRGAFSDRIERQLSEGVIEYDEQNNTYRYIKERKKFDNPV